MSEKIRVLVVDDSVFYRVALPRMLAAAPDIEVVDVAKDGAEAVAKTKALAPDVVTLDIIMPVMDGLSALREIMREKPVPVVMLSSLTRRGGEETIESLSMGAVDFIEKPDGVPNVNVLQSIKNELITKVRAAAGARLRPSAALVSVKPVASGPISTDDNKLPLVVMAASTGGPNALQAILPAIPADFPGALIICQHISPGFLPALVDRLGRSSQIQVRIAEHRLILEPGVAYALLGDDQVHLAREGERLLFIGGPSPVEGAQIRGNADAIMMNVAQVCGAQACGVVLTGMGSDGAQGLFSMKKAGALTIAQDEESSVIFGMPARAAELGAAELILPVEAVAEAVTRFAFGFREEAPYKQAG